MLNEKRVKHMVKLASYESKNGAEEFKISSYFRGDYISFNVLCSMLWATVGYIVIVALLGLAYMDAILEGLTFERGMFMIAALFVGYVLLLIAYGVISYFHYKKKHLIARGRMKRLAQGLEVLEKLYDSES